MRTARQLRKHRGRSALVLLTTLLVQSLVDGADPLVPPAQEAAVPAQTEIAGFKFTLADGLTLSQAATPELIRWPVVADWDREGRLVVIESGGVSWPIEEHNKKMLHNVVRLVDDDQDGEFDRRILAANNLPFAEGVLCLGSSMLVSAPPNIWKLTDADGDGYCESRTIWFEGQTITGCANDLHGPYLGPDGWVYWCKGAFGSQKHELVGGQTLDDSAAHIFRRPLEGGPIEVVVSGGMDNPVEVAFSPEGELFFTSTFLQHPAEGRRDGIAHGIYGGVFGKDHRVIHPLIRTGPLMPITEHLGPAAPSGLLTLDSQNLLNQLVPTLVSAQFNLQKVASHELQYVGASFTMHSRDLVVADRVDFHPTDVLEDADGSLLIIDTGGWYDLCCPTSSVDQDTAPGGIYRLSQKPSRTTENSGLSTTYVPIPNKYEQAPTLELLQLLTDKRPWVRREARLQLRRRRPTANQLDLLFASLDENIASGNSQLAIETIWDLSTIATPAALQKVADVLDALRVDTLSEASSKIAQAALHTASVHRLRAARQSAEDYLATSMDPALQRSASELLGRIGNSQSVAALFDSCQATSLDDLQRFRELEPHRYHALVFSLIEMQMAESISRYLDHPSPVYRWLAIKALQANPNAPSKYFNESDIALSVGLNSETRVHPEFLSLLAAQPNWSNVATLVIVKELVAIQTGQTSDRSSLQSAYAAWKHLPDVQAQVVQFLQGLTVSTAPVANLIVSQHTGQPLPKDYSAPIAKLLAGCPPDTAAQLADALASTQLDAVEHHSLVSMIADRVSTAIECDPLTLAFVAALPPQTKLNNRMLQHNMVAEFVRDGRLPVRRALQRIQLSEDSARTIIEQLELLPPSSLRFAVSLFREVESAELQVAFLQRLPRLTIARTIPIEELNAAFADRYPEVTAALKLATDALAESPEDIKAAVAAKLQALPNGDAVRGLQVFRSAKSSCSGCHKVGYIGNNIGPELSKIGRSRSSAALLEAVMFPSARIEQSFQADKILTVDGEAIVGLVKHAGDHYDVTISDSQRMQIPLSDVVEMQPSMTSIMPAGIDKVLSDQELADLLQLLQSLQ